MRVIVIESSEKQECVELVSCITRYEVFRRKENLVAVTTVDVASDVAGCRRNWQNCRKRVCLRQANQERR